MRVKELELTNFQSYDHGKVKFPEGTTFIRGEIGTGKSTLLRAIFCALFQTDASDKALGIDTLDELVKLGEDSATVKLTFEVEGVEYTVEWTISVSEDENGKRTAKTRDCVLSSPALDEPIDGYTSVNERITGDIVQMDSKAFVNSVYVQQHDIRRLLSADAGERQEILDGLLGLDKLDTYIARMEVARAAAHSIKENANQTQGTLRDQLSELDDENALKDRKREIAREISEKEGKVEDARNKKSEWEEAVRDVKGEIESFEEREKRLDKLEGELTEQESEVETLTNNIREWQDEQKEHSQDIERLRNEITEIDDAVDDYTVSSEEDAEAADESLASEESDANAAVATAKTELSQAESKKDELQTTLKETKDKLTKAEGNVDELEDEIEDAEAELNNAEEAVSEAERTRDERAAAFLDIAADDVTQDHESDVEARVTELDGEREDIGKQISAKSSTTESLDKQLDNVRNEIEGIKEEKAETEPEIDRLRDEELPAAESNVNDIEARLQETVSELDETGDEFDITVTIDTLEAVRDNDIPAARSVLSSERDDAVEQASNFEAEVTRLEDQLEHVEHLEDGEDCPLCGQGVPEDLSHEDRRDEVESAIETAKQKRDEARRQKQEIDDRNSRLDTFEADIRDAIQIQETELANAEESVESIKETLSELRDSVGSHDEKLDELSSKVEEVKSEKEQVEKRINELRSTQEELIAEIEKGEEAVAAFKSVEKRERQAQEAEREVERLTDKRESAAEKVTEQENEIERVEEELEKQGEVIQEKKAGVDDAKAELEAIRDTKSRVTSVLDKYGEIGDLEREIESLRKNIEHARERREDIQSRIKDIKSELDELRGELADTDIDSLRSNKAEMESNIEKLETAIEDLESGIRELDREQTGIESTLQQIERLQERVSTAEEREAWASDLYDEFESVRVTYEQVKSRLREKNIALLEQYVNDLFDALYQQQSFERVELRAGYEMAMVRADGERMTPRLTSGGEGAILNLALRAAIYRLIAEKEARAGELPPLILDEPTEGLDNTHIREVTELIEEIRKWDVPQVFVVTHQEELFDSGFNEIVVEMNTDTQSSTTEVRTGSIEAASIGGDD